MWNFKFIVVLLFLLCLMSCDNSSMINQPSENDSGGICGVVTDFATGEPIKNANVQLRPTGETTLTGTELFSSNCFFLRWITPVVNYSF